jgi:hypothetical protein
MSQPTVLNVLPYRGELVCEVDGRIKPVDFLIVKSDLTIVPGQLDLKSRSILEIEGYSNLRDAVEDVVKAINAALRR